MRLVKLIHKLWDRIVGRRKSGPGEGLVEVSYLNTTLRRNSSEVDMVREAQRHLRALGYLKRGIDGKFRKGTERAVRSLQFDLIHTDCTANGAPVSIRGYNKRRVTGVSGVLNPNTAACIQDMLNDPKFTLLPYSEDPESENARIAQIESGRVPMPFLKVILQQESGMRQFEVPRGEDEDNFILIGLDRKYEDRPDYIASRGYGAGQYTLFHHPPTQEEVDDLMISVQRNVAKTAEELRGKFDYFINGEDDDTRADDRINEFGTGLLRLCKYQSDDPRYLTDCRRCALDAGETDIIADETRFYEGSDDIYEITRHHRDERLTGVPIRQNMGCDWPYAVRRYNGSGVNSYWYQSKLLLRLKSL